MTGQAVAIAAAGPALDADADVRTDPTERLAALFEAHHERLYRLARRLAGTAEDARDLVQDTYLRAARSPQSVPAGASHEEAWLVRVLVNLCRDRWRMRATHARLDPRGDAAVGPRPHDLEAGVIARTLVWRALDRLPPRRRAAVVLYELEGATIPAIAQLLGITAVTVRWHLSVGRRELARIIRG